MAEGGKAGSDTDATGCRAGPGVGVGEGHASGGASTEGKRLPHLQELYNFLPP